MRRFTRKYCLRGIYSLTNTRTGRIYIGSSCDINKRISQHMNTLKNGTHDMVDMQADYNAGHCFNIDILYVENADRYSSYDMGAIRAMENEHIRELPKSRRYNRLNEYILTSGNERRAYKRMDGTTI